MQAAVCRRYGPPDVVSVEEIGTPSPRDDEILVRVRATTVSAADRRIRGLSLPRGFEYLGRLALGITKPRKNILGVELAGQIEAVGKKVTKFAVGQRVFAFTEMGLGCHAQYRAVPENGKIALMPANASFPEAASLCFGGTAALYFLRDLARIASGERVLVVGACGAVGSAAVQLARHFGADVTGVANTQNLDFVLGLGAGRALGDVQDILDEDGERYDAILDAVGNRPYQTFLPHLRSGGRLLLLAAGLPQMISAALGNHGSAKVIAANAKASLADLAYLAGLFEAGLFKPPIDSAYPLERIVEAHARAESRHKKGSVVVIP